MCLYRIALCLCDGLYAVLDVRPVGEHALARDAADVGDVDVDREPRYVEHEQVDGGAAVQRQLAFEGGVAFHLVQEVEQALDLVHGPRLELVGTHNVHDRTSSSLSGRYNLQRRLQPLFSCDFGSNLDGPR